MSELEPSGLELARQAQLAFSKEASALPEGEVEALKANKAAELIGEIIEGYNRGNALLYAVLTDDPMPYHK